MRVTNFQAGNYTISVYYTDGTRKIERVRITRLRKHNLDDLYNNIDTNIIRGPEARRLIKDWVSIFFKHLLDPKNEYALMSLDVIAEIVFEKYLVRQAPLD